MKILGCLLSLCWLTSLLHAASVDVYLGTGGQGESKGIYHATFDTETGDLSEATLAAEVNAPGFLARHPKHDILYAAAKPGSGPAVLAYAIEPSGALTLLNAQPVPGGVAAHLSVHPSGRFLLTAQYGAGSVALFPLEKDGRLLPHSQLMQHKGTPATETTRPVRPHPHWTGFSPDGRFAFVPDLGLDQIVIYKIQSDQTSIQTAGHASAVPGSGPRHMRFSVDGRYIFLLNEHGLSVSTFAYDAETGTAERIVTTPTLSEAMKAGQSLNAASEILVHPNGRYVFAANRGHDSVTAFQVDTETGHLYVTDNEPVQGAWPRHMNLDPSGRWLLVAGARSDSVAVFAVDLDTGALTFTEEPPCSVPNPICVLMADEPR